MFVLDQYSIGPVPIEMYFRELKLAIGTAFVWENVGRYFLITNWHNVTGKDRFTDKHINEMGAEPDRILLAPCLRGLGRRQGCMTHATSNKGEKTP